MSFYRLIILEDDLRIHLDIFKSVSCDLCPNECHSEHTSPIIFPSCFFKVFFECDQFIGPILQHLVTYKRIQLKCQITNLVSFL